MVANTNPVGDHLWEAIQPLLAPEPIRHHGGLPRVSHRAALAGILFILRHGLRWCDLPLELGYGSGITCWRRLRQWQALGIWVMLQRCVEQVTGQALAALARAAVFEPPGLGSSSYAWVAARHPAVAAGHDRTKS